MWFWISSLFCLFRSTRPKLTLEILVYLFFSAAFGYSHRSLGHTSWQQLGQYFLMCESFCLIHFFSFLLSSAALSQYTFFYGLQYTTATFAITFTNMAPVLTFLIAVLLRCSRIWTFSFPAFGLALLCCLKPWRAYFIQGGVTEHQEQGRSCKDHRNPHVVRWCHAPYPLQGCGLDTRTPSWAFREPRTCSRVWQEELDPGYYGVTGKLPVLLLLASTSVQAHQEVSGTLLQHCLHVPDQFPARRGPDSGDTKASFSVGSDEATGDRYSLIHSKMTLFPLSLSIGIFTLLLFLLIKCPWILAWWSPYRHDDKKYFDKLQSSFFR